MEQIKNNKEDYKSTETFEVHFADNGYLINSKFSSNRSTEVTTTSIVCVGDESAVNTLGEVLLESIKCIADITLNNLIKVTVTYERAD